MRVIATLALVVGLGATAANASSGVSRSVTVAGTGTVSATPNRASFSFGVTDQAKTASAALDALATDIRRVIAALKAAGLTNAQIQTQSISVDPRYSDTGDQILGYSASSSVSADVNDLNRAGAVIDAAVHAGANQVSGPNLTRSDQSKLYLLALRGAIANARAKAQAIARASGARLGRVLSVAESSAAPTPQPLATADASKTAPIQAGTTVIEADVTVVFALL